MSLRSECTKEFGLHTGKSVSLLHFVLDDKRRSIGQITHL